MVYDVDEAVCVDRAAAIANLAIEGACFEGSVVEGWCALCGSGAFGSVRGAKAYRDRGLKRPGRVREAVAEYRADSDVLGEFIASACVTGDEHRVAARALYRAYAPWAREAWDGQRLGPHAFGRRMRTRFGRERKEKGRVYAGIGLRVGEGG